VTRKIALLILLLIFIPVGNATPEDFYFEVSEGTIPGHTRWHVHGINPGLTNVYEDIWEVGGTYVFPTVAVYLNVSSNDSDDTLLGSGARTVTVQGLDSSWLEISETINMSGTANVTSTLTYIRINRVYVDDVGSQGFNDGDITVTSGVITLSGIDAEHGRDSSSIFSVPVNQTAFLINYGLGSTTDKRIEFDLLYRPFGKSWQAFIHINTFQFTFQRDVTSPQPIPEKSDIRFRAKTDAPSSVTRFAYFDVILVTDTVLADPDSSGSIQFIWLLVVAVALLMAWGYIRKR